MTDINDSKILPLEEAKPACAHGPVKEFLTKGGNIERNQYAQMLCKDCKEWIGVDVQTEIAAQIQREEAALGVAKGVSIQITEQEGKVMILFNQPVGTLFFNPEQALGFAEHICSVIESIKYRVNGKPKKGKDVKTNRK
jgi:hypothetical protein